MKRKVTSWWNVPELEALSDKFLDALTAWWAHKENCLETPKCDGVDPTCCTGWRLLRAAQKAQRDHDVLRDSLLAREVAR